MPARDVQDYIETALEPLDWGGGALGVDWGAYVSPGNPFTVGSFYNPVAEPPRYSGPPPPIFPTVLVQPPAPSANEDDPEAAGDESVLNPVVISPYEGTDRTVYESAPGGIFETNRLPTDWDWVYENYVREYSGIPPITQGRATVPIDWGRVIGGAVGGLFDPFGAGQATTNYLAGFAAPPTGVPGAVAAPAPAAAAAMRFDSRTGRLVSCKRRRRRRLLTDGDFNDLMRISTLPNKDIVKIALAKAVGR